MADQEGEGAGRAKGPLSAFVAENVKRIRTERRIKQTELAEALERLGRPIGRVGLQRLERGERKVDLDDLVALSRAFDIPPVALIFPIGRAEVTELAPGEYVDVWAACRWFTGKAPLEAGRDLSAEAGVIGLFEDHDRLALEVESAKIDLNLGTADDEKKREYARTFRITLRDLRALRAKMRQRGLVLPRLDDYLAFVDDVTFRYITDTELAASRLGVSGRYPAGLLVEDGPDGQPRPVQFRDNLDDDVRWLNERAQARQDPNDMSTLPRLAAERDERARLLDDLIEGPDEEDPR